MHFCPHLGCDYRGWPGLNNLRANGHPSGGPWRQFHCISCNGFFPEYHGTIFHGKQAEVDLIVRVLTCFGAVRHSCKKLHTRQDGTALGQMTCYTFGKPYLPTLLAMKLD
jgi:hypothetical protein